MYDAFVKREQADRALFERNAYITGLLANTNLDDGKQTKSRMLESVDIDYQNVLRSIYNINIGDEVEFDQDPFFKAMKIPGVEPESDTTVPDRTTDNPDIDIDQVE